MKKAVAAILLLTALLFGFTTCEGGFMDPGPMEYGAGGLGGGYGGGSNLSFKKGTPSAKDLDSVGITAAQFNAIVDAGGRDGYKGYAIMSMSSGGRAAYSGNYKGAYLYVLWGNRPSTSFKALVKTAEQQWGIPSTMTIDWDDPNWETQMLAEFENDPAYSQYLDGFRYSDWYMAFGMGATSLKMWYLMWAKNSSKSMGSNFSPGDMMMVYLDMSNYYGDYDF
jgi:hypothetical protein